LGSWILGDWRDPKDTSKPFTILKLEPVRLLSHLWVSPRDTPGNMYGPPSTVPIK
jgi:hypothetical protein